MAREIVDKIEWLGHDGFAIKTAAATIVIDPFELAVPVPADLLLITHPHYDHCSIDDINAVKKPSTVIITEAESAGKLSGDVRVVKPGQTLEVEGFSIEAVPAYNINKSFHPKAKNWLGFIVTIDGKRVYHAGDTDLIPEMETISVDVALLPVSGTYVMTADEAIEAAKRLKPEIAIPMHYDSIVGSTDDAAHFKDALEGICEVAILTK